MDYKKIKNKYYPINSQKNKIDVVFYHMNCADGTMSCALWLYNNMHRMIETHIYPIDPSTDIVNFFSKLPYNAMLTKYKINFIFLDVVPRRINEFIVQFNTSYITIIDHHIGNKETIDSINANNNISIDFKPKSLYGATKQVVDRFIDILPKNTIEFSIKIAAMDMWNAKEFKDVNYIHYGISYYCFKKSIKMLSPEEFITFSLKGMKSIEYFVSIGKKWYNKAIQYITKKLNSIDVIKTVEYKNYFIGIIELNKIFNKSSYIKQTSIMSNVFCFMLQENPSLKNKYFGKKINTLAFIKNGGVSLRIVSIDKDLDMNYLAKKICRGGGHKPAAGCSLNYFIDYVNSVQ